MDYAEDIMFLKCSCCCLENQRLFIVACGVPLDLYLKPFKSTTVLIDIEVAIDTVLKNAHCTFKNEL